MPDSMSIQPDLLKPEQVYWQEPLPYSCDHCGHPLTRVFSQGIIYASEPAGLRLFAPPTAEHGVHCMICTLRWSLRRGDYKLYKLSNRELLP